MKTIKWVILVLIFPVLLYAQFPQNLPANVKIAYRTLLTSDSYPDKQDAAIALKKYFEENGSVAIVDIANSLIIYTYSYKNYKANNSKMYYNDKIACILIEILELSQSPDSFYTLVLVVSRRNNHNEETVNAAWRAIKAIDWSKGNS